MILPGFKTSTTKRSVILDAAVKLVFSNLEAGYNLVPLSELASISSGGTPPRNDSSFYGGNIPWAKIGDVTNAGKWIGSTEESITEEALQQSSAKLFPKGTVLFSMYGSIGKTAITTVPMSTNQAILGLEPRSGVNTEYLYYSLINARLSLFSNAKGTSQKNINGQMVKTFKVPKLPPEMIDSIAKFLSSVEDGANISDLDHLPQFLEELQRIVVRIEELATRIEEARELRNRAKRGAETLIAATISNLHFDENCWTKVKTAVLDKKGAVRSGPFGSQLHHEEFVDSGVVAIGTRDVQVNRFILNSGWHITPEKFEQFRRYQVFPGDVLTTIVGGSIGRFCVVPSDVPLAFTTKHVMALTLNRNIAEPRFISFMLNYHKKCRESIFAQTEGSAQPSLNATKVLKSIIPLPSISEQRSILAHLDALKSMCDALQHLQAETVAELDALMPSILERAFKGEL